MADDTPDTYSLDPERWQHLRSLLEQALDLPPSQRADFLDRACADAPSLRIEVEAFLRAEEEADDFLAQPLNAFAAGLLEDYAAAGTPPPPLIGQRVGNYRLIEEIGRGGMGVVFLAERDDAQFRQRVAVKLLRGSMQEDDLRRRFLNERQILANLQHPNIARLYDGGMTDQGQPYFIMEYVEGLPLIQYCDTHRLPISRRLHLFLLVCQAVQYAHRNLVVHRDLKPSNILVTAAGEVKLLDFGIAKVLEPDPMNLLATQTGLRLMTPAYASPEQILGHPITTAADVYALGTILYELLTGHRPYRLPSRIRHEIARIILEEIPTRPSTMITQATSKEGAAEAEAVTPESIGKARNTHIERLKRQLRGDLDNIVLMTLRKEPEQRYASVEQLSEDVRHHLEGLPISARKPTATYRMRKFAHRHWMGIMASAFVLLSLLGGLGVALWQSRIAQQERDVARQEAAIAAQVKDFIYEVFAASDPSTSRGEAVTARALLDRGAERVATELTGQPAIQAELMDMMGRIYQSLGINDAALPFLEQALALRQNVYGPEHEMVAASLAHLGDYFREGNKDAPDAIAQYTAALTMQQKLLGEQHPETINTLYALILALHSNMDHEAAKVFMPQVRQTVDHYLTEMPYGPSPAVFQGINQLAMLMRFEGDTETGIRLYEYLLPLERAYYGDRHPMLASTLSDLGNVLEEHGDRAEALANYEEALAMNQRLYGMEHEKYILMLNNLARIHARQENPEDARPYYEALLPLSATVYGTDSRMYADHNLFFGSNLRLLKKYDEAEHHILTALAIYRNMDATQARLAVARGLTELGEIATQQGRPVVAEEHLREALTIWQQFLPPKHRTIADLYGILGASLTDQGRFAEAESMLLENYAFVQEELGAENPITRKMQRHLFALYTAWGKPTEAARYQSVSDS